MKWAVLGVRFFVGLVFALFSAVFFLKVPMGDGVGRLPDVGLLAVLRAVLQTGREVSVSSLRQVEIERRVRPGDLGRHTRLELGGDRR